MAYSGIIRRLLISSPGDVPLADLALIHKAINRWNGIYGPRFGTAVIPISWGEHAAAEFGSAPQDIINRQLVDSCDMCIAVFANRLGTPTSTAESGTAEEIQRLSDEGKYVGILHCRRPVNPDSVDPEQIAKLQRYLAGLKDKSLIFPYADDAGLANYVDNILTAAVSRDQERTSAQLEVAASSAVAEIWPRIETRERVRTDQKGRVRTQKHWYLVLHNSGAAPARDVNFRLEPIDDGEAPWAVERDSPPDHPEIEVLSPGGEYRFQIFVPMGSSFRNRCIVSWVDARGNQENSASLRLT